MVTWQQFAQQNPAMAEAGYELLYQFGLGLGFLATVRKDGGPRVHPVCPLIHASGLYLFILHFSPKRYDLERDGRFALHSFPPADIDDEFYCTGRCRPITDHTLRTTLTEQAKHDVDDSEILFELLLDRALHTTWENPRQPNTKPIYTRWRPAA